MARAFSFSVPWGAAVLTEYYRSIFPIELESPQNDVCNDLGQDTHGNSQSLGDSWSDPSVAKGCTGPRSQP